MDKVTKAILETLRVAGFDVEVGGTDRRHVVEATSHDTGGTFVVRGPNFYIVVCMPANKFGIGWNDGLGCKADGWLLCAAGHADRCRAGDRLVCRCRYENPCERRIRLIDGEAAYTNFVLLLLRAACVRHNLNTPPDPESAWS